MDVCIYIYITRGLLHLINWIDLKLNEDVFKIGNAMRCIKKYKVPKYRLKDKSSYFKIHSSDNIL